MTLVRISTQASAQAVGVAVGVVLCLGVLAVCGLPSSLAGWLVGGLAIAGPTGAIIGARKHRHLDRARPMPPDSPWTSGRVRGPSRILSALAFAAFLSLTSASSESSFAGTASGLLLVLTGVLAARATEALLAAHVERRDGVVLLELRGWWGLETPVVYSVPPRADAAPVPAHD